MSGPGAWEVAEAAVATDAWIAAVTALEDRGQAGEWVRDVVMRLARVHPIAVLSAISDAAPSRRAPVELAPATVAGLERLGISARWWVARWPTRGPEPGRWYGSPCGCPDPHCLTDHPVHDQDGTCACVTSRIEREHLRAMVTGAAVTVPEGWAGTIVGVAWGLIGTPVTVRLGDGHEVVVRAAEVRPDPWPPTIA